MLFYWPRQHFPGQKLRRVVMFSMKNKSARGLVVFLFIVFLTNPAGAVTGDLNSDRVVDWQDLGLFVDQWLAPAGCPGPTCADFSGNGNVDFVDFAMFAANWTGADPIINEFMAANSSTITDNYGDYDDWIEIYNPTTSTNPVNGRFRLMRRLKPLSPHMAI